MIIHPDAERRSVAAGAVRAAAVLGLAAMLSGCYAMGQQLTRTEPDRYPYDYRQRHPIVIKESERVVHLFVGTRRGTLLPGQRADVVAFAGAWQNEATGGIVIEVPNGTPNERAATDTLREIHSLLAAAGVPPEAVAERPYRPADPVKLATVRLVYPRMAAQLAGPCGLWPKDTGPSANVDYNENKRPWNFGCANQRALASMVANPSDLVQPAADAPIYTARRTFVLDKHRKGETSATQDTNPNKGKISDIAQ